METVIETRVFQRTAKAAGMTEAEIATAIDIVSKDPLAGDLIVGSGGCRKVRVPGRGKGKSGGYRLITFHAVPEGVYLMLVFSKGAQANLTDAQVNILVKAVKMLA